jgi:hypothetical protein
VTGNVPFHPDGENPASVTWTPTFSASAVDTAIMPVVPASLAPVTVTAVVDGGFVPAKQDATWPDVPSTYCRQTGWLLPIEEFGPLIPEVTA